MCRGNRLPQIEPACVAAEQRGLAGQIDVDRQYVATAKIEIERRSGETDFGPVVKARYVEAILEDREVRDGVVTEAGLEHEGVAASAAGEDVIVRAAVETVAAVAAIELIVAEPAEQRVVAVVAKKNVIAALAVHRLRLV